MSQHVVSVESSSLLYDLSVARNYSWMSRRHPQGPNKYMFLPLWKLGGRVGIP